MSFRTSESTVKLDEQLAKAQGEVDSPEQTKLNPFFKSRYADISDIWKAIRPALKKYEISLTQWPLSNDDLKKAHILTRVSYKGEWITCEGSIPIAKADAHGYASAITYLKRISLCAVLGISFEEDDDGNHSTGGKAPSKDSFSFGKYKGKTFKEIGKADLEGYLKYMRTTKIDKGSPMEQALINASNFLKEK